MYSLTIHFGPNAVAWSFLFKSLDNAQTAFRSIGESIEKGRMAQIIDDYGQTAHIGQISGYLLEDTELGTEARILRGLDNARGQARANKRAMTDPEIQQLQRGQGPSVLTPFNGGLHRQ